MKLACLSLLLTSAVTEAFVPAAHSTARKATIKKSTITEAQTPEWDTKQHLYGIDLQNPANGDNNMSVTISAGGEVNSQNAGGLPLPETYVTCGKCKCLFAIAEEDLGSKGKGCRVKCSVCDNSWYQSRDRLYAIPTDGYEMLPSPKSELERIARNLAADFAPDFQGVNKMYVGNLDFGTTDDDLLEFFEGGMSDDSKVCDVSIVTGPDGRSRGFGFVTFMPGSILEDALAMNGKECNGRELAVREPNN
jgi:predicted Zn finger-like uncharacterized protein